ncbi:MAG: DUF2321 domain-containing protein [Oscillospiraceae bacterium]
MVEYEKAQICENGHVISMKSSRSKTYKFCSTCGAKILDACPKCHAPFIGEPKNMEAAYLVNIKPSAYCYECGELYPWTERQIEAVAEEIKLEMELTEQQQKEAIAILPDLVREATTTRANARKLKKILGFIGKTAAATLIEQILVFSCSAAKAVFLG